MLTCFYFGFFNLSYINLNPELIMLTCCMASHTSLLCRVVYLCSWGWAPPNLGSLWQWSGKGQQIRVSCCTFWYFGKAVGRDVRIPWERHHNYLACTGACPPRASLAVIWKRQLSWNRFPLGNQQQLPGLNWPKSVWCFTCYYLEEGSCSGSCWWFK